MASGIQYSISRVPRVTPENLPGLSRMVDIYAQHDPVVKAFKVADGRQISDALRNYLLKPIGQGLSFIATEDNTKQIIGLCINHVDDGQGQMNVLAKEVEDDCEKELVRFWLTLGAEPKSLTDEKLYNIEFNIVDPAYRKSGIAIALGKKALTLAYESKQKYVRSECSNNFTCLIADKMGYTREFSIAYADVLDSKGNKVFTDIQEPHTHLHIYILYMDQAKTRPYLE